MDTGRKGEEWHCTCALSSSFQPLGRTVSARRWRQRRTPFASIWKTVFRPNANPMPVNRYVFTFNAPQLRRHLAKWYGSMPGTAKTAFGMPWPLFDQAVTPAAVLVPKVESADSLAAAAAIFARHSIPLIALIETVAGLRIADSIARVPGVGALVFGSADYAAEVGCTMSATALAAPRAHVAQAAGSAGIGCLDGAWLKIDDIAGLRKRLRGCPRSRLCWQACAASRPARYDPRRVHPGCRNSRGGARNTRCLCCQCWRPWSCTGGRMLDAPVVAQARRTIAVGAPHSMSQGDRP